MAKNGKTTKTTTTTPKTTTTKKGATVATGSTMTKSEVKAMQTALQKAGYSVGSSGADGIYGKDTAAAVAKWKADTGNSNTAGWSIGTSNYNKLVNGTSTSTSKTGSSSGSSSGGSSGSTGTTYGTKNYNSAGSTSTGTTPQKQYLAYAGDSGTSYAEILNKAQAYLTGNTYTAGQAVDGDWWGASGGKSTMYGNGKTYKGQAFTSTDIAKAYELANLYDQQVVDQKLAEYADMDAYYQQVYDNLKEQYDNSYADSQANTAQTIASIEANKDTVNEEYEKAQKENYVNKVLQENQMGDYLSAMGYNGGLTESTLQGINNNYATNRQTATSERDSALRQIEQLVAEARTSGNSDLVNLANEYLSNYTSALQNQAQMNYQISESQRDQANTDRDYQLQLQQAKLNQQMYDDEKSASETSAAQQLAENDFNTFLDTYQGKYTKEATYKKWIENLKNMSDPYGYNKQKIAYLTQYVNSTFGNSKKKVASGGSTYYVDDSGDDSGNNTTNSTGWTGSTDDYNTVLNTAVAMMSINSTLGPQNAANHIANSNLTTAEKKKAYTALGLI
jgi:hypothetical protein